MSKATKDNKENKDTNKSPSILSKRTKILISLFVFFMVVFIITNVFKLNSTEINNQPNTSPTDTELSETDLLEPELEREAYVRPDYETLDFYTALQSLGYELDFLYEDLKDYYTKGDKIGKTLQDLKDDRHFIVSTLDTVVQKDIKSSDSVLDGESVELMYTFDEAVHYLDQVIHLIENDKKQLTTYQYNQAKEKISSFEQVITYIIFLQEEALKDAETEEQDSQEGVSEEAK